MVEKTRGKAGGSKSQQIAKKRAINSIQLFFKHGRADLGRSFGNLSLLKFVATTFNNAVLDQNRQWDSDGCLACTTYVPIVRSPGNRALLNELIISVVTGLLAGCDEAAKGERGVIHLWARVGENLDKSLASQYSVDADSASWGQQVANTPGKRGMPLVSLPAESDPMADQFCTLLARCTLNELPTVTEAIKQHERRQLKRRQTVLAEYLKWLEKNLSGLELGSRHFGSYDRNRDFATTLRDWLKSCEWRLRCRDCGRAGTLVCYKSGGTRSGIFRFDHFVEGRKVMCVMTKDVPIPFDLQSAPPDRRRKP